MKCTGVLYVSGSSVESSDWAYEVWAECDAIPGCGFRQVLAKSDDCMAWGIASDEMIDLQILHQAHKSHQKHMEKSS